MKLTTKSRKRSSKGSRKRSSKVSRKRSIKVSRKRSRKRNSKRSSKVSRKRSSKVIRKRSRKRSKRSCKGSHKRSCKRSRKGRCSDGFRSRRPLENPQQDIVIGKYYYIINIGDRDIAAHGKYVNYVRGRRDFPTYIFNNLTYFTNGKSNQDKEHMYFQDEFSSSEFDFEEDIPDADPHF